LEPDGQEDDVRLDGFRESLGNDPGADRGCGRGKALRVSRGCNGYVDTPSGKCPRQGLADLAEADDCVAHALFLWFTEATALRTIEWSAVRPSASDLREAAVDGELA